MLSGQQFKHTLTSIHFTTAVADIVHMCTLDTQIIMPRSSSSATKLSLTDGLDTRYIKREGRRAVGVAVVPNLGSLKPI